MAPRDGLESARRRRPRARRGDGHRPRRRAPARPGSPRHRARPEPGHARDGAAPVRRPGRARRGVGRRRSVPGRHFDHLTFTYLLRYVDDPARRWRARPRRPAGRHDREPRVLPPARCLATALGPLRRRRPACARPHRVARLVRRRPLPRSLDPRLLRALSPRAPARALAGGRDRRRPGAADERWRRRRDLRRRAGEARVLRPAAGRVAGLRDAAPPAVHGLAPRLRRRRRLSRRRGVVEQARVDRARLLPRHGHRRARARRAHRQASADVDPVARPRCARGRLRGVPHARSASLWLSASASGSCR